jgi:hypothetical protein
MVKILDQAIINMNMVISIKLVKPDEVFFKRKASRDSPAYESAIFVSMKEAGNYMIVPYITEEQAKKELSKVFEDIDKKCNK